MPQRPRERRPAGHVGVRQFEVSGPGAERWLDSILTNKIPKAIGRVSLTYLLTKRGGVRAEFTLTRTGPEAFYLVSAGALETQISIRCASCCPATAGCASTRSRRNTACWCWPGHGRGKCWPGRRHRSLQCGVSLAHGATAVGRRGGLRAMRVNFVGELGYEFHHPIEMQNYVFDALMAAGAEFGIKPFGIRAMDSLRLEESYKLGSRTVDRIRGLRIRIATFVDLKKGDFLGRDALLAWREKASPIALSRWKCMKSATPTRAAPSRSCERRFRRADHVGRLWLAHGQVAGARDVRSRKLPRSRRTRGPLAILGTWHRATVVGDSPYDPANAALRS